MFHNLNRVNNTILCNVNNNLINKIRQIRTKYTGGHKIYDRLIDNNVKDVFVFSGGSVMPIVDAFYKGHINYYVNNNLYLN